MKRVILYLIAVLISVISLANETITISEFHSKNVDNENWHTLTGVITSTDSTGRANQTSFYLTDTTATVWGDNISRVQNTTTDSDGLGSKYSKVTNIASLANDDKVILYADDIKLGVTGWNGNKDATVASEGWVEYIVEIIDSAVYLKDGDKYISLTSKNRFEYAVTGSACYVTASGVFYCILSDPYYLYENASGNTKFYRMYTDKSNLSDYTPFYMYKVGADTDNPDPKPDNPDPKPDTSVEFPPEPEKLELTRAEYWYDFTGTGEKGMVRSGYFYNRHYYHLYTSGASNGYKAAGYIMLASTDSDSITERSSDRIFVEDINGDGKMDIWVETNGNQFYGEGFYEVFISTPDGYRCEKDMLIIPNFDVNSDGRLDYLHQKATTDWAIMVQQADGSFVEQYMQTMTLAQYENKFDVNAWQSTQPSTWSGLLSAEPAPSLAGMFGGASLAKAPQRRNESTPQHAPGINNLLSAPTRALDLNADGRMDLVNEKDGIIYYNVGDGKWVMSDISGAIMVADLNGDDIQDFIYPGIKLQTVIYRGEGNFDVQLLYENIQVDSDMYCYDFDRDGDVDILVTFSAPLNNTGYAYTMFFENDGTGRFTQLEEQDYGEDNQLLFSNCQDLDGDGYYDMLAFRGNFTLYKGNAQCDYEENLDVVWLKGLPNKKFAQPELLITYTSKTHRGFDSPADVKINAEDIDNDGKIEIWSSGRDGFNDVSFPATIAEVPSAINTAPVAPEKPSVIYHNGTLLVSWGNGNDTETATSDLTYALRIGTTSSSDDILHAHANADGTRRNFLDGNMGKYHNYKLDLSQHIPSTIYVSVQTIDAQHKGSAWSEEALVEHTAISAKFRLSTKELGRGQTLTATAYELPKGFTHTWHAENGVCVDNDNTTQIIFNTIGTKTITHTVTAIDGTSVSAIETVNVMPNYATTIDTYFSNELQHAYKDNGVNYGGALNRMMADYNMDGYWDLVGSQDITYGIYENVISKGEADYAFAKASGIWNTGLDIESAIWYDWDHNGAADVIFITSSDNGCEYYYLPHNGSNNLQAKKSDEHLAALKLKGRTTNSNAIYPAYKTHSGGTQATYVDFTHNGYYDVFAHDGKLNSDGSYSNFTAYLYSHQSDGSYQKREITGTFDNKLLSTTFALQANDGAPRFCKDINHDGFTDVCMLKNEVIGTTTYPYKELTVMVNKGDYEFEQLIIPFEQEIAAGLYDGDLLYSCLEDMNNDGYIDIVAARSDMAIYIMWNEKNERFLAPKVLPLGELDEFYYYQHRLFIEDVDNNGYLDVVSMQQDKSVGDNIYGTYVHYFDANGVMQQGFVETHTDNASSQINVFKLPNHSWTVCTNIHRGHPHYDDKQQYLKIQGTSNERPSSPDGVRAVQTADGLLIEWNDAHDDFTPAMQMQYNLSIKKKGETGAGAYIISPQNAGNSNAAPIRNYDYISANQYLVPLSVLPVGEYEIQVQAIDLQGDWSEFSEPISIAVQHESLIDAPTSVCVDNTAKFIYMGTTTSAIPVWDFDSAEVLSGSGYGPYEVVWNSVGTKNVKLTIDGNTESRMIYVEANDANVELPSRAITNIPMSISIPTSMTAEWYAKYVEDSEYMPINIFSNVVKVEDNNITFLSTTNMDIALVLINGNGCVTRIEQRVEVIHSDHMPTISYVTTNAEGKNVIYWKNISTIANQVRILKETNRYNQFVEIGVSAIADGYYIDNSSSATTKAERYVIQLLLDDVELPLPLENVHQTSHLTINQGLNNQTWNLIWNRYDGANIVSYNILRGTSVDNMTQIASVSSSNTSYTDITPDTSEPYYAIVYVLADDIASASRLHHATRNTKEGRSNVVNVANANKVVYAENIAILSANNKYKTTAEKPMLLLYAELMPVATTYQQVKWEITSGSDLATIDQNGLLTARTPNKGGTVTVKATTIDGTNLTATRNITIAAIVVDENPEPNPEDKVYFTVNFIDWDDTLLKSEKVEKGKSATPPANPARDGYTFVGWDTDFSNVQSDLLVKALYEENTSLDDIEEETKLRPRKEMIDGILYIIMPDGTKYTINGAIVK